MVKLCGKKHQFIHFLQFFIDIERLGNQNTPDFCGLSDISACRCAAVQITQKPLSVRTLRSLIVDRCRKRVVCALNLALMSVIDFMFR